jgi:cytochrome c oxidase assembly protein subunit 15
MDFKDAFVLWRGLGIDYEGGVLANPARVAIHVTHRLGAVVAGLTLLSLGIMVATRARGRLKVIGGVLIVAVLAQVSLGVLTVHWGVPLSIATMHNAGAAFLVLVMVTLLHALWPATRGPGPPVGGPDLHGNLAK